MKIYDNDCARPLICKNTPNIRKLILFGSRADGSCRHNSDIDLAFESSGEAGSQFYLDLEEAAELYSIDLIDLSKVEDSLLLEEIHRGIVLFER